MCAVSHCRCGIISKLIYIITSKLNVYPATGGQINELGTNNPIVMGQKTSTTFIALSTTQWYTSPTVPS